MSQQNDSEQIAKERAELDGIQARLRTLETAASDARAAADQQQSAVDAMVTSLADHSDAEIDRAQKQLRASLRTASQAQKVFEQFSAGEAHEIGLRLEANLKREFECKHATARKIFFNAVREQLSRFYEAAAHEKKLDGLARAAGFSQGPAPLLAGEHGAAGAFDHWRRRLVSFDPSLLDDDDPQLAIARAQYRFVE